MKQKRSPKGPKTERGVRGETESRLTFNQLIASSTLAGPTEVKPRSDP